MPKAKVANEKLEKEQKVEPEPQAPSNQDDLEYKNLLHFFHSYLNGPVRPRALETLIREVIRQVL